MRKLSPKSIEIMQLLADGFEASEIVELTNLSYDAIISRMKYARRQLDASNTTHAIAILIRRNIIQ